LAWKIKIVESMQTPSDNPTPFRDAQALGTAIRNRRRALGLRQEEIAMQSGISVPTVSAIENGKPTAQIGLVLQVCKDLGLKLFVEV